MQTFVKRLPSPPLLAVASKCKLDFKKVNLRKAGSMTSSIQDVAKAAGVSISTVSRSFTRPDLVSAKTRKRVLDIANELNFSLSRSAAALKSGKSLRIAVLMSGRISLWFTAQVIEGLNEVLHAEGYDISIFQVSSIEDRREFFDRGSSASTPSSPRNADSPPPSTSTMSRARRSPPVISSRSAIAISPTSAPTAASRCHSLSRAVSTCSANAAARRVLNRAS